MNINLAINSKVVDISNLLTKTQIDILACTETGLSGEEKFMGIREYNFKGKNRRVGDRKGGGIGFLINDNVNYFEIEEANNDSELYWIGIEGKQHCRVALCIIYLQQAGIKGSESRNREILNKVKEGIAYIENCGWNYIIMGDFNGHIGKEEYLGYSGPYEKWNENGKVIVEFSKESGIHILNLELKNEGLWTWQRGDSRGCLDLVMCNNMDNIRGVLHIDDKGEFDFPSDHNLTWLEINLMNENRKYDIKIETKWDLGDKNNWGEFKQKLEEACRKWEEGCSIKQLRNQNDTDRVIENWGNIIVGVGVEVIGKIRKGKGMKAMRISGKIRKAMNMRAKKKKIWVRRLNKGVKNNGNGWKQYLKEKKLVNKLLKIERAKERVKLMDKINRNGREGGKLFWKHWKSCNKEEECNKFSIEEDGKLVSDKVKLRNKINQHFQELNKPHEIRLGEGDEGEYMGEWGNDRGIFEEEISIEEIKRVVNKLKNGKAVGDDDIPNEFLKKGGLEVWKSMGKVFNWVRVSGIIPDIWKRSYTKLLHKGGSKHDLDNYRGIAITSNVGKVFTKILANRLQEDVEERDLLGQTQFGFRKNRNTSDAIFILTQLLEIYKKKGRKIGLAFLDIRKAYEGLEGGVMGYS